MKHLERRLTAGVGDVPGSSMQMATAPALKKDMEESAPIHWIPSFLTTSIVTTVMVFMHSNQVENTKMKLNGFEIWQPWQTSLTCFIEPVVVVFLNR